jgi:hypothetical protein
MTMSWLSKVVLVSEMVVLVVNVAAEEVTAKNAKHTKRRHGRQG